MVSVHNGFPYTPIIKKLHTKTPLELRMCPFVFKGQNIKGQDHNALIPNNRFWRIIALPLLIQ